MRSGTTPKLVGTWTGPWRIVIVEKQHVCGGRSIVASEVQDVHVAHLQFHGDKELETIADPKEVLHNAFPQ